MQATYQLIVEIIIIGGGSALWVSPLFFEIFPLTEILNKLKPYDSFQLFFVIVSVAIFYQMGWIVNWLSTKITMAILKNKRKIAMGHGLEDYKTNFRPKLYQFGSEALLGELSKEISEMRICRANCLNAFLIILCSPFYGNSGLRVGSVAFITFLLLAYQVYKIHIGHYKKLNEINEALSPLDKS